MTVPAGVLLLADGRSPTGGLSHSGGVKEAVRAGVVSDETTLLRLLEVRLASAGLVAAGLAAAAAVVAALASISGPTSAAVRLLGLDPIAVTGLLARLGPRVDEVAAVAVSTPELAATGHALLDILAQHHAARSSTLFTS